MADYKLFGDVVVFDATYCSNKYKKPLVVFSGFNHHKQTAIFGFALLEDEEVHTYRWVLLKLVDVMDNKKPSVVVTDGDKAMRAVIADVLPLARHWLCGWHFEKNCVLRVKDPDFRKVFKKTIWATTYLWGTFCAGYRTTSRCKGINAFIKGFLKSTNSLLELVYNLDRVVKDYHNNEVTAQFYSTYYTPVLITGLDKIELFASKIYTRSFFKEVRKKIKEVGSLLSMGKDTISTTSVYKFSTTGNRRSVRRVLYDLTKLKIECDCHMWSTESIPCIHIFCVMKYEGLDEIPSSLILRRWCKDAKEWTPKETEG
ncbi:protein FAR1-RELATED SEQUENCE 5-like [Arachis duranensis]|uniref:Protein FAR1-RELATED SEQUENCE 5-like n=1 Tax=Arachis duranensis TaxID=130453 RepID=A0A6P5N7P1_ARADU|nr:protein FAR1-RELATED SEQUENCE 5-like [Arachis duranensis]